MNYFEALKAVHFPTSMKELNLAKRTLKYSQVLLQQLYTIEKYQKNSQLFVCEFVEDKISKAVECLSLYKDSGAQSIMLCSSSIMLGQYKQAFANKLREMHVAFQIIDEATSKENR